MRKRQLYRILKRIVVWVSLITLCLFFGNVASVFSQRIMMFKDDTTKKTDFADAFNAIWKTHNASNILEFVEQAVATNKSPATLFARGVVALELQEWGVGAIHYWEQALQMIVANNMYPAVWEKSVTKTLCWMQLSSASEKGDALPSWNANAHAEIFAHWGDEVPHYDELKEIVTFVLNRKPFHEKIRKREKVDSAHLAEVALEKLSEPRCKEVKQLNDQALLEDIARNDETRTVRYAAVSQLEDQTLLTEFAWVDKDDWIRSAAVRKLNDQALLTEFAKNDKSEEVRWTAAAKLDDQALRMDIAQKDSSVQVRMMAIAGLKDKTLLAEVAKDEGNNILIRHMAIRELSDPALLAEIAKSVDSIAIRREAETQLKNLDY